MHIITNFDGVCTDTHSIGETYRRLWTQSFAREVLDGDIKLGRRLVETAIQLIADNPDAYPWYDASSGLPSTPPVDEFIRMDAVIPALATVAATPEEFGYSPSDRLSRVDIRNGDLHPLLKRWAASNSVINNQQGIRPQTREYLRQLGEIGTTVIVTSSATNRVRDKLRRGTIPYDRFGITIHGNAKKQVIDPAWEGAPESVQPEGFPNPIFPRRRLYHQALEGANIDLEGAVVVGDVYQLDLSMPEQLGANIVLFSKPFDPKSARPQARPYEIAHVERLAKEGKGLVTDSFERVIEYCQTVKHRNGI
jgi:hypothetical protein